MSTNTPTAPAETTERGGPIDLHRADTSHGKAVGGSDRDTWNTYVLTQALYTYWCPSGGMTPEQHRDRAEATALAMASFRPTSPIEAMMAAQAVALHNTAMECGRRSMIASQPLETAQMYRKAGANASRAFIEVVGAIDRHRGKHRQQTVRVERVTVEAGAQAVVGVVQTGGAGGAILKTEGHAHEYSTAEGDGASCAGMVVPPVRRKDTTRNSVPISRDQG